MKNENLGPQFVDADLEHPNPDIRVEARQAKAKSDKEYGKAYRRGRAASMRYRGGGYGKTPQEKADDRNEPRAWYHGYEDHAAWG